MRKLKDFETKRIALLTSKSAEIALIEPTQTGLKKSIMDATASIRNYLLDKGLHDYENQGQGQEHKAYINAYILDADSSVSATASLYRPNTKSGDPRIWFKMLARYCDPNDILALIAHDGTIYVLNITQTDVQNILEVTQTGPIWDLLNDIDSNASEVSDELLAKLRRIASRGLVPSVLDVQADTAIGRTLETLLGIDINSSREPDYKGIELKSYRASRGSRQNRKTLFAQVANWEISKFKSSREILENFGYDRGEDFKLYCTVSTQVRNSQGLMFKLDDDMEKLIENSDKNEIGDFAVWLMDDLKRRLLEKHNETFWVAAQSHHVDGNEHFQFTKVRHTRKPISTQFDLLVEQGAITMDHLIKKNSRGRVAEKGPLFKIDSASLELLFPPSVEYDLQEAA